MGAGGDRYRHRQMPGGSCGSRQRTFGTFANGIRNLGQSTASKNISGSGRAGKTLLLRRQFPKASYFLLEDPEVVARPGGARLWFGSYLQTYLERDVRAVTAVKDLALFRRFLALLASRHEDVPRASITAGGNADTGCRSRRAGAAVAGISRSAVTARNRCRRD